MSTATLPSVDQETVVEHGTRPANPWTTVLWNDDVNVIDYVIKVLQVVLQKPKEECTRLTNIADAEGRVVVFTGSKEEATDITEKLQAKELWATVEVSGV